ncbi:MAG: ATP-binding protein [Bdellovibrionota bacterium]
MVFLGGPRQVGKTTLAQSILGKNWEHENRYLNWDSKQDRKQILNEELPTGKGLVVLDEIHKYRNWRNLIKGLYDKNKKDYQFLVTGSARLDYYRRGGDSLQGRYHYFRLHPLSIGELNRFKISYDLKSLLGFGGFPEPFIKGSKAGWRRWQNQRLVRVINEDLINLERVQEISQLTLMAEVLESKVGSPLSVKALAEDLEISPKTAKHWLQILSNLYYCFLIPPYGSPKIRAVKKEQKLYLWDWSLCEDKGARFENMVACQLLKYCHFIEDTLGYKMELRYIRDTDKREVDFVVIKNKKPEFAVECKYFDTNLSRDIFILDRTPIKEFYQVHTGQKSYQKSGVKLMGYEDFVDALNLP